MSTLTALSLTVTTKQLPAKTFSYVHCVQASVPYHLHTFASHPSKWIHLHIYSFQLKCSGVSSTTDGPEDAKATSFISFLLPRQR